MFRQQTKYIPHFSFVKCGRRPLTNTPRTPTGLHPSAQGCLPSEVLLTKEGEATLGKRAKSRSTLKGLHLPSLLASQPQLTRLRQRYKFATARDAIFGYRLSAIGDPSSVVHLTKEDWLFRGAGRGSGLPPLVGGAGPRRGAEMDFDVHEEGHGSLTSTYPDRANRF